MVEDLVKFPPLITTKGINFDYLGFHRFIEVFAIFDKKNDIFVFLALNFINRLL